MKHYLIISHGSKIPNWSQNVILLAEQLKKELKSHSISYAFLDSLPTLVDKLYEADTNGFKDIVLVPLFIAPSIHMNRDIPVICGLISDSDQIESVKNNGYKLYNGDASIFLNKSLMYVQSFVDLVSVSILMRLEEHKCNKLVVLSHGSSSFNNKWDQLISSIKNKVQSNSEITIESFYVGTGKKLIDSTLDYFSRLVPSDKVLIYGLYLGYGSDHIIDKNVNLISEQGLEKNYINPNIIWTNDCISKLSGFKDLIREIILRS